MGKRINALLGRSSTASKLKTQVKLAISRITILKKKHNVKSCQALSDVVQILQLGNREDALLRVEHVIKEQSVIDTLALIESYLHLLMDEIEMIKTSSVCPEQLKEAIASLIFAASRFGDFPELQKIRTIFTSHFGKEFASGAVELRNNCGVYPKMIQRRSTRQESLESRQQMLTRIAKHSGIQLDQEDIIQISQEESSSSESTTPVSNEVEVNSAELSEEETDTETHPERVKGRKLYKDAAQDAFDSAAYEAEVARDAVELASRLEQWKDGRYDHYVSHQDKLGECKTNVNSEKRVMSQKMKNGRNYQERRVP